MINGYCRPHSTGVSQTQAAIPFYVKDCITCEAKRAAGTITGKEPPPLGRAQFMRAVALQPPLPQFKRAKVSKERAIKNAAARSKVLNNCGKNEKITK